MVRRAVPGLLVLLAGCLNEEDPRLVEGNFFKAPIVQERKLVLPTEAPHHKPTEAVALKVMALGRKLVDKNRQIGLHPTFTTVGVPHVEVFHRNPREVWVTEGLVKECKDEGQLAAVLALELGKIVSEREALASPAARAPELEPPPEVRVGNDSFNRFGPADGIHLAELARYEKAKKTAGTPLPPPPPEQLAEQYLRNAGYEPEELARVRPLLRKAHQNYTLEKQMLHSPGQPLPGDRPAG